MLAWRDADLHVVVPLAWTAG